jgi:hypothetical protein
MEYLVEPEIRWLPVMRRSIGAFHEGKILEGAEACRALLNAPDVPAHIRELTSMIQLWYAQPLPDLAPDATWQPLAPPALEGWTTRDPTPVTSGDALTVLMRATPDEVADERRDLSGPLRERVDGIEFVILAETTEDGLRLSEMRPYLEHGALRLAVIARGPGDGEPARAGVLTMSESGASEPRLIGPRAGDFGQGWAPVMTEDGARFISWWQPTEVFRISTPGSRLDFERVALRMAPQIAERFRGGSPGVSVPGGYLFLVNEVATLSEDTDAALARFVRIDEGFQITDISPQFFVAARGKDLATGLARQGDRLVAGFTSGAGAMLLATMGLEHVLRALIPVKAPGPRVSAVAGV